MKTIEQITREYCGMDPPEPIPQLNDAMMAVARMAKLLEKINLQDEDLFGVCACAGAGVVASWRNDYRFCRSGGISKTKLYEDSAIMAMMSEEGTMIGKWADEHLPGVLDEVDQCDDETGVLLWMTYCAAAYRYGMALEQQIMDMDKA